MMSREKKFVSKFRVVVGDWSGDGHDKTQECTVIVPDRFTAEILGANYKKNVKLLGVDPESFANEYEDSILPDEVAAKLEAHGLILNDSEFYVHDKFYFGVKAMVKIVMFLFGYGLEGFTWELEELAPVIAGGYRVEGPSSIGYGLFY